MSTLRTMELERLARWIRSHDHHAHVAGGKVVIGIATVDLSATPRVWSTSLEYAKNLKQARDALGY